MVMNVILTAGQKKNQQGIALIIVLGFLSILTVMAVSFAINMRTERLTSRMYLDSAKSRHFLDVGLARALSDLDLHMNTPSPAMLVLNGDFFPSVSSDAAPSKVKLFTGIVTNYLPVTWNGTIPDSEYVLIKDPFDSSRPPVGRYAYLAVNLTGFLDVNKVGTAAARNAGRDPNEITISDLILPDISSQWGQFRGDLQTKYRRIETLYELRALGLQYGFRPSINFVPFSRALTEVDPDGNEKIDLGRSAVELRKIEVKTNIIAKLLDKCELVAPADAEGIYNSIVDFVDEDFVPENPNGLSGEPVPMINEIVASGKFTQTPDTPTPGQYTYALEDFKITVEMWYPFPIDSAESFILDPTVTFSFATPAPAAKPEYAAALAALNPTNGAAPLLGLYLNDTKLTDGKFNVDKRGYYSVEYRYGTRTHVDTENINAIGIIFNVVTNMNVLRGTDPVDSANAMPSFTLGIPKSNTRSIGTSCLDPRLNHQSMMWEQMNVTLGAINARTKAYTLGEPRGLGEPIIYSRNYPMNKEKAGVGFGTVADLGSLSIGEPWKTLALYKAANGEPSRVHPILDYFTVKTVGATDTRYGYINLNSRRSNALAAVFYDMPINAAPEHEATVLTLNADQAKKIADEIHKITLITPFDKLSNIGSITNIYETTFDGALDSDALRESIIRNSVGLFSMRDNLFGVIVDTQTLSDDGIVTGSERALAIIWRDPILVNGINETIVRFYTMLGDY